MSYCFIYFSAIKIAQNVYVHTCQNLSTHYKIIREEKYVIYIYVTTKR